MTSKSRRIEIRAHEAIFIVPSDGYWRIFLKTTNFNRMVVQGVKSEEHQDWSSWDHEYLEIIQF